MIARRHPHGALTLGEAVPHYAAQQHAPAHHCTRCGCRLRHQNHTAYCAPCTDAVWPWQPPTPTTVTPVDELERRRLAWHRNASEECECGSAKSRGAATCLRCYLNKITNKDPWHGPECPGCGGHKAMDARMCHQCRYPNGAI